MTWTLSIGETQWAAVSTRPDVPTKKPVPVESPERTIATESENSAAISAGVAGLDSPPRQAVSSANGGAFDLRFLCCDVARFFRAASWSEGRDAGTRSKV